jgi:hypothetical protein
MTTRRGKTKFMMSDEHRQRIANSQILKCLIDHVQDGRPMSPSQVSAGLGLLKKILPDLSATDMTSAGEKLDLPTIIKLVGPSSE